MILRQPKIRVGLRIVAAGCIVLWLQATSHCALERLFGGNHHHAEAGTSETLAHHDGDHSPEAEAAEYADCEASHSHDSAQSSHDSHHHRGGDTCRCYTMIATVQIAQPFIIVKPILEPLNLLCTVLQTRDSMFAAPGNNADHQAKRRDRVFTPEVCLDPAHRSLAPPSLA